jgi:hypothetical protein
MSTFDARRVYCDKCFGRVGIRFGGSSGSSPYPSCQF